MQIVFSSDLSVGPGLVHLIITLDRAPCYVRITSLG